ncbi:MAG: phosphoribosylglycinamide formyltransferase [Nitratireductor sp.]|nr:phosphoribosylglycinamide formyltransferase [Nitratireductor sp.]
MTALIQAAMQPEYPAMVRRVISNRADAKALSVAEAAGIETLVVAHKDYDSREAHEAALAQVLDADRPDFICLAGYMRILTGDFVKLYSGRLVNIHPSLLPSFKGIDTHERALAAGMRIHGASVHFVSEGVDDGPVIAQAAVPVLVDDSAESLSARVLAAENRLYPRAVELLARGNVRLSNGRAVFSRMDETATDAALFSPALSE